MKRQGLIWLLSGLILLIVMAGCSSLAGAKSDVTLRMGVVPKGDPAEMRERYESLIAYLEKELSVDIELYMPNNYDGVIAAMKERKIDFALFGSYSYVKAEKEIGAVPLVMESYPQTGSGYRSLIVTRRGNGITSIADLRDKPFAFVDRTSTSGFLMPNAYFQLLHIQSHQFFSEARFMGSHDAVAKAVKSGRAVAGALDNQSYEQMLKSGEISPDDLTILWKSELIPGSPIAAHPEMDAQLRAKLTEALLTAHTREPDAVEDLGLAKYVKADRGMYQSVRDAMFLIDAGYTLNR
ncbi:phosphonate transport system substrate-binding protein [Laceyella sediminis]|jgi:phosphonate transport system substrate-binding protein|uniref:Phosphonate transport system substrate-binding protein n=1 Tax=Laceyella sediminis TaxID=573074 RepID=A0ABX5EL38_9BACL|nr:phosphate/phosphite/phosphonate ABC transporter substrate-binding protein [Laceyella sediminis]PRZ12652.1 phosphonate transport system substrate-binding protein [Laceyella sediminis]